MISIDGNDRSWTSTSTTRSSSLPARSCSRMRSRVPLHARRGRAPGSSSGAVGRGGSSRSSSRSSVLSSAFAVHVLELLLADHVHGELDEVAHHRLDVAADVADLGELRRFDLDERRLRELGQAPRDLGLADAGRADHQDVLRRHILGQLGRQLLAPHAVAQRDGDRALGLRLADDVLVELGDDLARRQRIDGAWWCAQEGKSTSQFFDGEVGVGVDADLGGDRHRVLRRSSRGVSAVWRASALAAACANAPPEPMPMMPSSGSIRSPVPDSRNIDLRSSDDQHRLEAAQRAIGAPVLGQLDRRALEVAAILLELRFEAREQRERIGGRPGEPGQDVVVVEPADLARALLDDGVAERDLAVAGEHGVRSSRRTARIVVAWKVESIPVVSHRRMTLPRLHGLARCRGLLPSALCLSMLLFRAKK